jgi:hypothetical protein
MHVARVERIEAGVDAAAAAIYAAGTAVVLYLLDASSGYVVAGMVVAFGGCLYGLRSIEPEFLDFALPAFEPQLLESVEAAELLLTDADRVSAPAADDALILDDILDAIGPDSRVVRLFDPQAMPSPAQLKTRIDKHLEGERAPDASEALHEALAQLRRSLG